MGKQWEKQKVLHVLVRTMEQLEAACEEKIARIYLDYTLLFQEGLQKLNAYKAGCMEGGQTFFLAVPYIVREKDKKYLERMEEALQTGLFEGILIRNLESYQFFYYKNPSWKMVLDANLYIWNRETLRFWDERASEFYLPIECNRYEWRELLAASPERKMQASAIVYGRLPMMITANCIRKTMESCSHTPGTMMLKDRYEKQFPVYMDCLCCYNVLYNSVPLSLHKVSYDKMFPAENLRLDFTTEEKQETLQVIRYYRDISNIYRDPFYKEYTTGHYKRGVE